MNEYSDLDIAPSPDFADILEAMLLRDLGFPEGDLIRIDRRVAQTSTGRTPARRRLILGLSSAAAAVLIVVAIVLTRGESTRPPVSVPSSTQPTLTTLVPASEFPDAVPGDLPPGTYQVTPFEVDFTFEATDDWIVNNTRPSVFVLDRIPEGTQLSFSTGVLDGRTAEEVATNLCPGALDIGPSSEVTLFDQPATRIEATVTSECPITLAPDIGRSLPPGLVIEIQVAEVDGKVVVATFGSSPALWEQLRDEVDALFASTHLIE